MLITQNNLLEFMNVKFNNHYGYRFIFKPIFFLLDIFFIVVSFILSAIIINDNYSLINDILTLNYNESKDIFDFMFFSIILWTFLSFSLNLQHVPRRKNSIQFFKFFIYPQTLLLSLILLFYILFDLNLISNKQLVVYFILEFSCLLLIRVLRQFIMRRFRRTGYNHIKLLVLAKFDIKNKIYNWTKDNPQMGYYIDQDIKSSTSFHDYKTLINLLIPGDYLLIDKNNDFTEQQNLLIKNLAEDKGAHVFYLFDISSFQIEEK